MLKNDRNDLTTHYTGTDRDNYLQTDRLFCTGTAMQQDNCSPKDKKEKFPRFAFLKIFLADRTLQHICKPHKQPHNQSLQKSCNLANPQINNCLTNKIKYL